MGAHYLSTASVVGTEQHFDVVKIIQHENFNHWGSRTRNDVALIKLSSPAVLQKGAGLVCLSGYQFRRPFHDSSRKCWTTSWDRLYRYGPKTKELVQLDMTLVSPQNCSSFYSTYYYDANTMICARGSQRSMQWVACHGESGGPLVCEYNGRWYLEGVTQTSYWCGSVHRPTVFADIRHFRSWITQKMNNEVTSKCTRQLRWSLLSHL